MTERPIIFSRPSIQAILGGRKTQTRRVIRRPERFERIRDCAFCCPYGVPGDRLWVRETFVLQQDADGEQPPFDDGRPIKRNAGDDTSWSWVQPIYRATDPTPELYCPNEKHDGGPCCHWRSPIHMPRWASRLTLEITDTRVERLQEISEDNAIAEGFCPQPVTEGDVRALPPRLQHIGRTLGHGVLTAKFEFTAYWAELNAERAPWSSNPWVWAITFKLLP